MSNEINLFEEEVETSTLLKKKKVGASLEKTDLPKVLNKIHEEKVGSKQENAMRLHVKRLIEALFFASAEPISFNKIREITDQLHPMRPKQLKELIAELQNEYLTQKKGFRLDEIAQGYLLRSCEEFSPYIELLYRNKRMEKLSQAATEVLAIIAYRQPITRPQIEAIRGVDSSGVVASLLERELIASVGKLEAPGRPTLYGITNHFLSHFGLKDIEELPKTSVSSND